MTGLDVRLDGMEYADIFPFYLALDAESRVVRFGAAWTRVHPGIRRGMALSACCRIVRPAVALPSEHLTCLVGAFVVLESLEVGLRLKGRVVAATGGAHYLFLGSPWVTDIGDLTRFGLTLDDLPAHESTSELLFLLQSQRRALEESRGLTAALREREGVLRSVLDTVADAIITTDASGTIRSFNAAATRVFGYTPDEVLGQNADILLARPYSRVPSPHAENPGTPSWTVQIGRAHV